MSDDRVIPRQAANETDELANSILIQPRVITPPKAVAPPSERGPDSPPLGRTLRNLRNARREIT